MKRSPLLRKTPLVAKTRLKRTEISRGTSVLRRTPLNPVSVKRRQQQPERRRVGSGLVEAQCGRCARCGGAGMPLHGHERLGMAQGASYIAPDVALCDVCNGAIEDDPQVSAWNGWKISTRWPHDHTLEAYQARALDGTIVDFTILAVGA